MGSRESEGMRGGGEAEGDGKSGGGSEKGGIKGGGGVRGREGEEVGLSG